ncbi:hypothetical protein [Ensifer sp. B1-9]|uniref:hypothetical protein n=1 Tax=Ensifer sp. B1-9 TaxID=3141455 RepID=UPI003D25F0DE
MQTMFAITPANAAALEAIVDVAKVSGEIDRDALVSMAETVRRESWMKECAAYLATKNTTTDEKAKIGSLMKTMSRNDARALSEIADPYKRGDLRQMIDALQQQTLSKVEQKVVKGAAEEVTRFFLPITDDRIKRIAGMLERKGISLELKTVRIGRRS